MTTGFYRPLPALAEARTASGASERLRALRRAAQEARTALEDSGKVEALVSCKLITFPYPTLFAFSGAALSPAPYVMMTNRMMVVQYVDWEGRRRTLLFNPTDFERGKRAPFYWQLRRRYGEFISSRIMTTVHGTVAQHLEALGLTPEDVDFIAFDHLHIQDVRGWLGGSGAEAFFPRARLLVQRAEWQLVHDLHPMQTAWFVPHGVEGIPTERVVLLDGDAWLGRGVAILSTPGHTQGNMSLVAVTERGTFVTSENGVATESYSPLLSGIPGIRSFCEQLGWEVVLNGNTREGSLEQYTSMVVEKLFAGPSRVDPSLTNFYPSSELTPSLLAPGLSPRFSHGDLELGEVRRTSPVRVAA
jgi:glyoxylase-like metal-dependent hydrolase (beta-lactamase superfamily II)